MEVKRRGEPPKKKEKEKTTRCIYIRWKRQEKWSPPDVERFRSLPLHIFFLVARGFSSPALPSFLCTIMSCLFPSPFPLSDLINNDNTMLSSYVVRIAHNPNPTPHP